MLRNRTTIAETTAPTVTKATQSQTVQQGLSLLTPQSQQHASLQRVQRIIQATQLKTQVHATPSPELCPGDIYEDDHDIHFEEFHIIDYSEPCNFGYTPVTIQQTHTAVKNEVLEDVANVKIVELDFDFQERPCSTHIDLDNLADLY